MRDPELDVCEMLITNKNLSKLMQLQLAKDSGSRTVSLFADVWRAIAIFTLRRRKYWQRDRDFTVREDPADLDGLSEKVQQLPDTGQRSGRA